MVSFWFPSDLQRLSFLSLVDLEEGLRVGLGLKKYLREGGGGAAAAMAPTQ